jgi:hypothetical protein
MVCVTTDRYPRLVNAPAALSALARESKRPNTAEPLPDIAECRAPNLRNSATIRAI